MLELDYMAQEVIVRERKNYMEDQDVLHYLSTRIPKQKESAWIRRATRERMKKELRKASKK